MFNDRDLGILGAGALLAVLCLFLPISFAGKMVVGFLVLVGFMALALLRLGPDRVPPEVWLARRFRYSMQTRRYVNQQSATGKTENIHPPQQQQKPKRPTFDQKPHEPSFVSQTSNRLIRPIGLAWEEIGAYSLLTTLLGVIGVYFVVWLANGGARELSTWFR